jgi:lipopolysaccharide transport system ATP-binding protein
MSLINVTNLGKAFVSYRSELQRFARWFGFNTKANNEHWVLRDVNFQILAGEAVGIIGQNGAGKSTLLKMITGTLNPSEGGIQINGRIAAILELGMGFNPDLTGRQNVYHSAGLMGFTIPQIDGVIDEIESFAEIGEYFDQQTRIYSSGMQVRVAFSVATAFRPEILIIDEALSVGDTYFQHKSFNKIKEFQEKGSTLLIVSHDKNAIQTLCSRAILIDKGSVVLDAGPEEVFDLYNARIAEKQQKTVTQEKIVDGSIATRSGTGEAKIESIVLLNQSQTSVDTIHVGEDITFIVDVKIHRPIPTLVFGYGIKDRLGQVCYGTNTWYTKQMIDNPPVGNTLQFKIQFPANLGVGSYSLSLALHDSATHLTNNYEWRDLALVFNVVNVDKIFFIGDNWLNQTITVNNP